MSAAETALRRVLGDVLASLPQCTVCNAAIGTRAHGRGGARYCDACATQFWKPLPPEYPRAEPVRRALALLRAETVPDGAEARCRALAEQLVAQGASHVALVERELRVLDDESAMDRGGRAPDPYGVALGALRRLRDAIRGTTDPKEAP